MRRHSGGTWGRRVCLVWASFGRLPGGGAAEPSLQKKPKVRAKRAKECDFSLRLHAFADALVYVAAVTNHHKVSGLKQHKWSFL